MVENWHQELFLSLILLQHCDSFDIVVVDALWWNTAHVFWSSAVYETALWKTGTWKNKPTANHSREISGTIGLCLRREERTRTCVPAGLVLFGTFPHGCNVKPMGQAERPGLPPTIETSHRTCCQSMRNLLQMLVSCSSLVFPEQCGKWKGEKEKRK